MIGELRSIIARYALTIPKIIRALNEHINMFISLLQQFTCNIIKTIKLRKMGLVRYTINSN